MRQLNLILLLAAAVALPTLLAADDGGATSGSASLGAWGASTDGSPDVVGEYEVLDDSFQAGLTVSSHGDWGAVEVAADARHSDDLSSGLRFDIARWLRSETTYDKLFHRLGHDPMTNLEATSTNGKVVFHTDANPTMDYDLKHSVLAHRTELQLPSLPALTLAVGYREQKREGHRQAYTVSHCDTCHVTSQNHPLNERTRDYQLEAKVAWTGGHARAAASSRELRQVYPSLTLLFDQALHPEQRTDVFDNRLQYDSEEGPQAVDLWPDQDKDLARLDLHFDDLGGFAVNAGGVWSETENLSTGLRSDYTGYVVNAARAFGSTVRLIWRGRVYTIDNDDVFVDTVERVTHAGPHAGRTYEEVYGDNYDWWRLSSLDREALESRLEASLRLGAHGGQLRAHWDLEAVDRDTYEVLPGEHETTTNVLGLSWRGRPGKGLRLSASYDHAEVDNPFMLVDGACSTLESSAYPNPWDPTTPQYDDQHQARVAETTASPSSWDQLKLQASFVVGASTLSGAYRWWDGESSDGDLTDWSKTSQTATVTWWSAPAATWDWYVAYAWQEQELDAPVCIPVFDG